MASIAQALAAAQAQGAQRLEAQLLLLHAMGGAGAGDSPDRAWLIAHGDDSLPEALRERFDGLLQRLACGEPVAYIMGHKDFHGLRLQVDPRVLVPRADTETLVDWALEVLSALSLPEGQTPLVLDLGTGSGAIALALKHARADLGVDAVDSSSDALAVAADNAKRLGLSIGFMHGRWLSPVTRRYHCIVANPPYIAEDDPHLAALAHEPGCALVSGADGLQDLRHIVGAAKPWLHTGAWLLLEHGFAQGPAVRALLTEAGYEGVRTRRDLAGHERCTGGQVPSHRRA